MQPKIYSINEHRLPPDKIDDHAFYVIHKLRKAGHIAYLVGGSVRDLLLGQRPKDFDISTSAKPEEVKKIFRNSLLIGRRFRLAHVRFGRKIFEVSTFRSGDVEEASLILRDNVWGTPEQDVIRRDFTINGLFYDPEGQTIIDFVDGFSDIEKKILRTIGEPKTRFTQDPVRMIRLLKFRARFGFEVDPETHAAMMETKEEILKSSPARIFEEFLRMLESGSSEPFFRLLSEHGFLRLMTPNLADYTEDNHENEIYSYLNQIDILICKNERLDRAFLLAAVLFPLLHKRIVTIMEEEQKPPHLGIIAEQVRLVIDDVFAPFFHMPRRIRAILVMMMSSQYRFVPLEEGKKIRFRIPKDPSFPLALQFFKLRCELEPDLLKTYTLWHEALYESQKKRKKGRSRSRKSSMRG